VTFAVDFSNGYGYGDDAKIFTVQTPMGWATVVKGTIGGSDESGALTYSYSVGGIPNTGQVLLLPGTLAQNEYDTVISVTGGSYVEPFTVFADIGVSGDSVDASRRFWAGFGSKFKTCGLCCSCKYYLFKQRTNDGR
jgi:hypothetical protein